MVKKYALSILFLVAIVGIKTSVVHALDIDTDTDFLYAPEVKTISMDFKDANLNDVLKIFSQQSGMNFIAATSVADKQINLYLDKVPVEAALERILSANGLTYEVTAGSNVFVVKELERPEIETITKVYNLKHASVSNSKLYKTLTIGESAEGDAAAAPAAGGEEDGAPTTLLDAVQSLIGGDEAVGSVVEDQRTNSLVVTTTPSRFAQIDQMIARLDVRIPQILI
ncbi:MAG: hypothetical protein KC618_03150, partial [Candidatus Omnitrophica bacterium]|nr:hypothetical protein [Candidatus Omnitrophota bacterium]